MTSTCTHICIYIYIYIYIYMHCTSKYWASNSLKIGIKWRWINHDNIWVNCPFKSGLRMSVSTLNPEKNLFRLLELLQSIENQSNNWASQKKHPPTAMVYPKLYHVFVGFVSPSCRHFNSHSEKLSGHLKLKQQTSQMTAQWQNKGWT